MAFDVTDDKFYQAEKDGMTWSGDSIQFGIYVGNNDEYIEIGQGGNNFNQLCFALTEDGAQAWRHLVQHSDLHNVGMLPEDSYKGAISRKDNHTYYEISVKWSELLKIGQSVSNRQKVGFAYVVNDNDGTGRKGGMLYGGGIFYTKDVSQFVYMSLLK